MAYDLAIFGSGFAGYEMARAAVSAGRSVIVIERGAADVTAANQTLSTVPYRREPVVSGGFDFGAKVPTGFDGLPRYIGLGGTSELWSGKWRRLDGVDLRRRYRDRQWPVPAEDLARYYARTAAEYGYPDWPDDTPMAAYRAHAESAGLRMIEMFEQTPPRRLRADWAALATAGVEVCCDAVIRAAAFDASGRDMKSVRLDIPAGGRTIEAASFVVACGGIESVHVSHFIRQAAAAGVDDAGSTLPERYGGYMDHPKAFIGELVVERHRGFVDDVQRARKSGRLVAFSLPEQELEVGDTGNHTVFLWPPEAPGRGARIVINLEQFPEPRNFISIGPASVSWRLSRETVDDFHVFMKTFRPRLERLFGPVTLIDSPEFRGASHPAGTLPMGPAGVGMLDADCRFRDTENLFCVSSAAFPVAGSANPTMTVVALAKRLSDRLWTRETS